MMTPALFDTSSLLALVRYYLPFDEGGIIKGILKKAFEEGGMIILDKIMDECKFTAKGIILKELDFIDSKSGLIIKTNELIPSPKFFNHLDNSFCNKDVVKLKGLTPAEFDLAKRKFLNGADANLLLYAQTIKSLDPLIVTEETRANNDGKFFKKIPENCLSLSLQSCDLPSLFRYHLKLNITYSS